MRLPRTGKDLYDAVQQPAEAIKGFIQIGIGVTVIVVFVDQWISRGSKQFNIVHSALGLVGYGLAAPAAVELAYTFFTEGPDEALNPLILGVSSFTLIILSEIGPSKFKTSDAIPISLLALIILLLFFARRFLLETTRDARDSEHAETQLAFGLGQAVRKRRMELKLSQDELGLRTGVSRRRLVEIEADRTIPTIPELQMISLALNAELVIETSAYKSVHQDSHGRPKDTATRRWHRRLRGLGTTAHLGRQDGHPG